jgi:hypothetical protein
MKKLLSRTEEKYHYGKLDMNGRVILNEYKKDSVK